MVSGKWLKKKNRTSISMLDIYVYGHKRCINIIGLETVSSVIF